MSLAATLNMTYLDDVAAAHGPRLERPGARQRDAPGPQGRPVPPGPRLSLHPHRQLVRAHPTDPHRGREPGADRQIRLRRSCSTSTTLSSDHRRAARASPPGPPPAPPGGRPVRLQTSSTGCARAGSQVRDDAHPAAPRAVRVRGQRRATRVSPSDDSKFSPDRPAGPAQVHQRPDPGHRDRPARGARRQSGRSSSSRPTKGPTRTAIARDQDGFDWATATPTELETKYGVLDGDVPARRGAGGRSRGVPRHDAHQHVPHRARPLLRRGHPAAPRPELHERERGSGRTT